LRDAGHGRLGGDPTDQGAPRAPAHPHHRGHVPRHGRGRAAGPRGGLRRLHGEADPRGRAAGEDQALHRIASGVRRRGGRAMTERILIVDDEPFNLDLLAQELREMGYAVGGARGGVEALARVESYRPDLVLLDYMMPGMSGLDVLRELRKGESEVPVVMI